MNLENLQSKESLVEDFFTWLFDDNRILDKTVLLEHEIDLTLAQDYLDANIYYPKQIATFFDTKAMKRLGRISQLDLAIDEFPNLYHNRLEHSKGVYNRKLEEMLYNYQDSSWKKNIENNNLKLHLLAELLKMAGHDIGHPPLSHGLEIIMFSRRGIHEDIGQRIMLEDSEIQSLLNSISPDLPNILSELYEKNILNFEAHDDSNNDVDRLDYLIRDNLYSGTPINLKNSNYQTVSILLDNTGFPKTNPDGSILTTFNSASTSTIDVYDYSSLADIENFLKSRYEGYKNIYFRTKTTIKEKTILAFFDAFLESNSSIGKNLRNYINKFKSSDITNFDLNLFLDWDDITFYSEILDIAQNHENTNIQELATMTIPNMTSFCNMIYSHLNLYDKNKIYSEGEEKFLCKLASIIKKHNGIVKHLINTDFFINNTIIFDPNKEFTDKCLDYYKNKGLIYSLSLKIRAYNPKTPIYIKDENGKIYELSVHPNRKCDWNSKISYKKSTFSYIPFLKLKGLSDNEINELKKYSYQSYPHESQQQCIVNMSPVKTEHNVIKTISKFCPKQHEPEL